MFWRKEKSHPKMPGPGGSGNIIDNIEFWFWDDAVAPGLIDRDRFDELSKKALTASEHANYIRTLLSSQIASTSEYRRRGRNDKKMLVAYFRKINIYLIKLREEDMQSLRYFFVDNLFYDRERCWVEDKGNRRICRDIANPVKAYINCLSFWNYPYGWKDIIDSYGEKAILITVKNEPKLSINLKEIQYLMGYPYRFEIQLRRGICIFNVEDGKIFIKPRGETEIIL